MTTVDAGALDTGLDHALRTVAYDLLQVVTTLRTPRLRDAQWVRTARERCQALGDRAASLRGSVNAHGRAVQKALNDMRAALQEHVPELGTNGSRARLNELRARLARSYEDVVAHLRARRALTPADDAQLRAIRLPKAARSLFHVSNGLVTVLLYELFLSRGQALLVLGSLAALAVTCEVTRRFSTRWNDFLVDRIFGSVARPRERYKTNSATFYLVALTILTAFTPQTAVGAAALVLAIGDPTAAIFGSRFGRRKLWKEKSYVGTAAFALAAALACFGYLALAAGDLALGTRLIASVVLAAVGAVAELFSGPIDDNLAIPLACGAAGLLFF